MKKEQVLEVVEWLKSNGDSLTAHNLLKVCEDKFESNSSLRARLTAALWGRPTEGVTKQAVFAIEFILGEIQKELLEKEKSLDLRGVAFTEGFRFAKDSVRQLCTAGLHLSLEDGTTEAFKELRARERAKFTGRSTEEVLADIESTMNALLDPNKITYLWVCPNESHYAVADMRREEPWPELEIAAEIAKKSYIAGPIVVPGLADRYIFKGRPHEVNAFKEYWAPKNGLSEIYGCPSQFSAGGFTK